MDHEPIGGVVSRSQRSARGMIALSRAELARTTTDAHHLEVADDLAWQQQKFLLDERFKRSFYTIQYLDSIAQLLSVQDYRNGGGNPEVPLETLDIGHGGEAFIHAAQFSFYYREQQISAAYGLRQHDPQDLPGYSYVTRRLQKRPAIEGENFANSLRQSIDRVYQSRQLWWRPLSDYLLPVVDTSRTRLEETRLGIGIGLLMINSAYGRNLRRYESRRQKSMDQVFKPLVAGLDLQIDESQG